MGLPYSVTFVDRGFSRYLAVFFSRRDLDLSSSSFLHSVINLRPPSVTISVQLWASRDACFQFFWILKDRTSLSTHATHYFSCPPRPFLTPSFMIPNTTRLGSCPPSMQVKAPPTTTSSAVMWPRYSRIRSVRAPGHTRGLGGPTYVFWPR